MNETLPKQYLAIAGSPVLERSLRALLACDIIEGICVALRADDEYAASLPALSHARITTAQGAEQRSGSVLAGLDALANGAADEEDWVLVHDAARPCVRVSDISRLIEKVREADCGGLLAEPVVDTVKEVDDAGLVLQTLDRQRLWRAQTPQMFRLGELRQALAGALADGAVITDEASAMERAGHAVLIVPGGPHNLKVTVPSDLSLAAYYLEEAEQCG